MKHQTQKKKMRGFYSIKASMLLVVLFIIVVLTAGILKFVSVTLSNQYDNEINANNETVTKLIASNLENFIGKAYGITEELINTGEINQMKGAVQAPYLEKCAARYDFIELLFVQDTKGDQTGRSSGECGNRADRWWFSSVNDEGQSFVSKSYLSATGNSPVSTVFMPLKQSDTIVGSIGMDIKLDYLQELIAENSDEATGRYSFVIDGEGVVIAHPKSEYVTQMYNYVTGTRQENNKEVTFDITDNYKKIVIDVMAGQSGSLYFTENDSGYYSAYAPIDLPGSSDSWSIITVQDEETAKSIITSIVKSSSMFGIVLAIFGAILVIIMANKIANPIKKISGLLSQAASGDFTGNIKRVKSKNEIGLLVDSFIEMQQKVSALLRNAKETTRNISESILILTDKSESATTVAENIKASTQEIMTGSHEQAADAERSAEVSGHLNQKFADLSQKTASMVEESSNAVEVTNKGAVTVKELKQKNETTYEIIEKTGIVIDNLSKESEVIGSILKSLEDISSQTNLLSLNASIEAARAGVHGRGFAVVAEEIQKLSVESAKSTDDINQIVTGIQSEISSSVVMMEDMKTVSKEQSKAVAEVIEYFEKILQAANSITVLADENEKLVEEMKEDNEVAVHSITNIAAISEETAACTESVSNAIVDQTSEIKEIAESAEELNEKARILAEEIKKFIVIE